MKQGYLGILLGVILAGATTYADRPGRGDSTRDDSRDSRGNAQANYFVPAVIPQRTLSAQKIFNATERDLNLRVALMQPGVADNTRFTSRVRDRDRDRDGDFDHRRRDRVPVVVVAVPVYVPVASDYDYVSEDLQGYYQPGYEWGASLRQYTVGWDQFGPYLEQYVVPASPAAQDAFRRGFIEAFGGNAEALYDRAMRRASQQG